MTQIVYSAQKSGFDKSRVYQNPRFFNGVLQPGATSVIVVGDWPAVVAAYEAAEIPVRKVNSPKDLPNADDSGRDNVSREVTTEHPDSTVIGSGKEVGKIDPPLKLGKNVEIPEKYDELSFRELKTLAARINSELMPGTADPDFPSKKEVIAYVKDYKEGRPMANERTEGGA